MPYVMFYINLYKRNKQTHKIYANLNVLSA